MLKIPYPEKCEKVEAYLIFLIAIVFLGEALSCLYVQFTQVTIPQQGPHTHIHTKVCEHSRRRCTTSGQSRKVRRRGVLGIAEEKTKLLGHNVVDIAKNMERQPKREKPPISKNTHDGVSTLWG